MTLGKKALIGIICAAVAAGGVGATAYHIRKNQTGMQEPIQQVESKSEPKAPVEESVAELEENAIQNVEWETSSEEARKAFNDWLADNANATAWAEASESSDLSFIAADLNGIPTLLVENEKSVHHDMERVFIYLNGEIQEVVASDSGTMLYPNDGVFVLYEAGMGNIKNTYYQVSEEGCTQVAVSSEWMEEFVMEGDNVQDEYTVNGKSCAKDDLDKFVKDLLQHSDFDGEQPTLLKNTPEIRENYFKIKQTIQNSSDNNSPQEALNNENSKVTMIADGTYYPFFIGNKERSQVPDVQSTDVVFCWLEIGNSIMQIEMDLGQGMQVYELPLASDVKYMESAGDDWEISADQLNSSFGKSGSLYGFNISLTIENGQVKEIWTFS